MAPSLEVPEHRSFCTACGSFLNVRFGTNDSVTCRVCGHQTPLEALTGPVGEIAFEVTPKPSEILRRLHGRNAQQPTTADDAVVDEECPVCKHPRMSYRTAQLRGLDEGQTIFYTCLNPECGHKYSLNS